MNHAQRDQLRLQLQRPVHALEVEDDENDGDVYDVDEVKLPVAATVDLDDPNLNIVSLQSEV